MSAPRWLRPRRIVGRTIALRGVRLDDAEFIMRLRTDESKGRYMASTPPGVESQRRYLEAYAAGSDGVYFIIETLDGEPLGTVRLYDARGDSFSWGSWIVKDGAPPHAAVESALMVYTFALDHLGFERAHCEVNKDNVRVWTFHERFGAQRRGERGDQFIVCIEPDAIRASLRRYARYLPGPLLIDHGDSEPAVPSPADPVS